MCASVALHCNAAGVKSAADSCVRLCVQLSKRPSRRNSFRLRNTALSWPGSHTEATDEWAVMMLRKQLLTGLLSLLQCCGEAGFILYMAFNIYSSVRRRTLLTHCVLNKSHAVNFRKAGHCQKKEAISRSSHVHGSTVYPALMHAFTFSRDSVMQVIWA